MSIKNNFTNIISILIESILGPYTLAGGIIFFMVQKEILITHGVHWHHLLAYMMWMYTFSRTQLSNILIYIFNHFTRVSNAWSTYTFVSTANVSGLNVILVLACLGSGRRCPRIWESSSRTSSKSHPSWERSTRCSRRNAINIRREEGECWITIGSSL